MPDSLPEGFPVWLAAAVGLWLFCLIATLILHEAGHAIAAALLGDVFGFHLAHVEHAAGTVREQVLVAAGGPALSLLQGVVFWGTFLALPKGMPTASMLALALGALGFATAFGYMLTTPFTSYGDLGEISTLLDLPMAARIALLLIGAAGLTILARLAVSAHLALLPVSWRGMSADAALALGVILPWLLAAPVVIWLISMRLGLFSALFPVFAGSYLVIGWLDRPSWPAAAARAEEGAPIVMALALAILALAAALFLRQRG